MLHKERNEQFKGLYVEGTSFSEEIKWKITTGKLQLSIIAKNQKGEILKNCLALPFQKVYYSQRSSSLSLNSLDVMYGSERLIHQHRKNKKQHYKIV